MKVAAFTGSLRKGSYNHGLLVAAQELAPAGMEIEILDVGLLPLYNQDLEANLPKAVADFKAKVKAADALLIATPEYNYSIPGVLKNAIDWGSRPYGDNSFEDKPAAILGASGGMTATARAQYHLRQTFVFLNVHALNRPECMVPAVQEKFDQNGKLVDQKTRDKIREVLEALVVWHDRLKI
jgi:chromate reductase